MIFLSRLELYKNYEYYCPLSSLIPVPPLLFTKMICNGGGRQGNELKLNQEFPILLINLIYLTHDFLQKVHTAVTFTIAILHAFIAITHLSSNLIESLQSNAIQAHQNFKLIC